jgi:acyl-CoA synthetase (AMP-forming)/AMP-acid ligase II
MVERAELGGRGRAMEKARERLQDRYWARDGLGGGLRVETHYDGRRMLCFAERPPTLPAMFADLARRFPARHAIVVDEWRITYGELDSVVAALAAGLAAHGIAAGDRVALFLGNLWEFLALVLAVSRLGAVTVPIGTRQRRAELEFLLDDCGAKALIFEAALAAAVPPADALKARPRLFALGGDVPGARRFAELMTSASAAPAMPEIGEEDTAVILYTSGTTGRPKGAQLTHLGIIHSALTFARCYGLGEDDRGLVAVPLAHVTGLVGVSLATMIVGGSVVLMRRDYKTPEFLALASRERITYSILVPAIYTLSALSPELERHDLGAWRIGCFGGAPMPISTIELLARKLPGLQLLNAYGATETTSPATVMPPQSWRDNMDSVGQVAPCGEIKVRDENGAPVPPGTAGELWIAGPMVVPGYWARPQANRSDFVDGFWRSGDIGSIDAKGFVRIFDRRKDMINRAGFKIFSAEVENVLSGLDGVVECAIIGRPDPVLGERVHAVVVPRAGSGLTAEAVRAYCAERLADYKVPETVTIEHQPLPRNANGKIQKPILRERLP